MYVNSSLVSAQNRERFYVFNWEAPQLEDRGIRLVDILESGSPFGSSNEKSYCLTSTYNGAVAWNTLERCQRSMVAVPIRIGTIENTSRNKDFDSQQYRVYSPEGKSVTICGNGGGVGAKTGLYAIPINGLKNGKSRVVDSHYANLEYKTWYKRVYNENPAKQQHDYIAESIDNTNMGDTASYDGKEYTIYKIIDGQISIKDKIYPINLPDGHYIIRKLTPIECERLQTMPDNYTSCVSNSQRYKCLGNGWTAEVIKHLWEYGIGQLNRNEAIEVLSMYDGIATARYVLESMGFTNIYYKAYEIDKYAIQVAQHNYPDIIQCGDAFQVREADWSYSNIGIAV